MLSACLLLPTDMEQPTRLPNRPPRVLIDSVQPPPFTTVLEVPPDCRRLDFRAYVEDPDNDTLYWRVFADYNYFPYPIAINDIQPRPEGSDGREAIEFSVVPSDLRFDYVEATYGVKAHVVELLLADREFEDEGDWRTMPEDAHLDRYTWTFVLKENATTCSVE